MTFENEQAIAHLDWDIPAESRYCDAHKTGERKCGGCIFADQCGIDFANDPAFREAYIRARKEES